MRPCVLSVDIKLQPIFGQLASKNSLYITQRERGHGEHKRYWGIKMNDVRELYLKTAYRIIDALDKYI
jgi:hypothetical protein